MRKILVTALLLAAFVPAHADPVSGLTYIGGTLPAPAPDTAATLDLSNPNALVLHAGNSTVNIPWNAITAWGCFRQNKHRLGVLATIGAGLVAARIHNHYFNLAWQDEQGHTQAVLVQIPSDLPKTIHVVLEARVPKCASHLIPQDARIE
jgi:hypothetical protein